MDVVEQKYKNFIDFLQQNIKNSTYAILLASASLERFLITLNNEKGSPKEITLKVCEKFNINLNDYPEEVVSKFERYVQYFQAVCKSLYK